MIRLAIIGCGFVTILAAQSDPRIVRTTIPEECRSPVNVVLYQRNFLLPLLQFQEVAVSCVAYDGSASRSLGAATFCGSDDNGTEQKYVTASLGIRSTDNRKAIGNSDVVHNGSLCSYPREMRIQDPPALSKKQLLKKSGKHGFGWVCMAHRMPI